MSTIIRTPLGRLRKVGGNYLLECPGCDDWLPLTEEMLYGKVSVDHAFDGCPGGYHETHDFAAAMAVRRVRIDLPDGAHMEVCADPGMSAETRDFLRQIGEAAVLRMERERLAVREGQTP